MKRGDGQSSTDRVVHVLICLQRTVQRTNSGTFFVRKTAK
ncbi:MAG: hypothetical protein QOG91_369 [Candidatus Parcubacteria bacterium]|jgi:hypothetical protein|nr:hypothetical protein [Candidatus Parcubacteria bacterium]